MNNLDRMYRHLVRTIRSRFPQYLSQPFEVAELYQTILPYRHHRRELGLESNDDYEMTLTELLSGAGEYLVVDDHMRDALRAELSSNNPDPSAFKQFASSTVSLSPGALRSLEVGPSDVEFSPPEGSGPAAGRASMPAERQPGPTSAPPAPSAAPGSRPSSPPVSALPPRSPTPVSVPVTPRTVSPKPGDQCPSCSGSLPAGRPITFCPFCGHDLTTKHCSACGSELELAWRFCPVCGRPAGDG